MDSAWYLVLRDIMVILAAAMLLVVTAFTALVSWRVYRLGQQLRQDLQPVISSIQETADTVRHTADFMGGVVSPAVGLVGFASGALGVLRLIKQLYRGIRR